MQNRFKGLILKLFVNTHSGMGRHSRDEVNQIGMEDIQAISDYLGNKKVNIELLNI